MKKPSDVTVEILKDIRTELQQLRGDVNATNAGLDALRAEMHEVGDDLGRRIVESEMRTATALTDLAGTVRDMTAVLRASADLRPRVE